MKLYADPITINCRKVIAALDLIQLDYDLVHVDYMSGAHKSEKFRTINPNAELPVLVDGSLVLQNPTRSSNTLRRSRKHAVTIPRTRRFGPISIAGSFGRPQNGIQVATSSLSKTS